VSEASTPAIATAVIVSEGRLLLARRREREDSIVWVLPGGEIEPGEDAAEAAVREALEETGLRVVARQVLGSRIHPATGREMHYVACDVVAGTASIGDADELDAVEWVSIGQLGEFVPYGFFAPVQQHLDELFAGSLARRAADTASSTSGPGMAASPIHQPRDRGGIG